MGRAEAAGPVEQAWSNRKEEFVSTHDIVLSTLEIIRVNFPGDRNLNRWGCGKRAYVK